MTAAERSVAFIRDLYLRRCDRVEQRDWGVLAVTPSLPRVWDANFAIVDRWAGTAEELHAELDDAQAEIGFGHRKTAILDEELAARVWPAVKEPDWPLGGRYLVMVHRREPDRRERDAQAEEVDLDRFAGLHRATILEEPWGADATLVEELLELDRRIAAVVRTRPFAVVADDGTVASGALLFQHGPVAQVEDVATLPAHRGRGYARAVVTAAVDAARRDGAETVFLIADESDWPHRLYERLGFDAVAVEHMAGRAAPDAQA
jgi:ribosomal protein S18 acetylase RimI-like enzyme